MAIALASKTNVDNSDPNFPFGKIRDDTGSGDGTPVSFETYNDLHQFFAGLLDAAGITANGLPDDDVNGYQYLNALILLINSEAEAKAAAAMQEVEGAWDSVAGVTTSTGGGGTFSVTGVVYNRLRIVGKTIDWQMQLDTVITGAPAVITLEMNPPSGRVWKQPGLIQFNAAFGSFPVRVQLGNSGTQLSFIRLDNQPFPASTGLYLNAAITAELA